MAKPVLETMGGAELDISRREPGILADRLLVKLRHAVDVSPRFVAAADGLAHGPGAQVEVVGRLICRRAAGKQRLLLGRERGLERRGDGAGQLALNRED